MKRNIISEVEWTEKTKENKELKKNKRSLKLLLQIANPNMLHNKGWN
jgi:hypothetical protein